MVQALVEPGNCIWASISAVNSSKLIGRLKKGKNFPNSGTFLHSSLGFKITVVSIIEKGAGSVEVSARPALPKTLSTSGKLFNILSWAWSSLEASVTDKPGKVVGI